MSQHLSRAGSAEPPARRGDRAPARRPVPFRDAAQRGRVCRVLLAREGLEALWSETGPRADARISYYEALQSLESDARILLLLAWAFWDHVGMLAASDLLRLSPENLRMVGELLGALGRGPDAVDAWTDRFERSGPADG